MSDWREGFAQAVTAWVIDHGRPANVVTCGFRNDCESLDVHIPFEFTAESNKIHKHLKECGLDAERTGRVRGFDWSEFEDTYSDNSEHQGVGVDVVCKCGKVKRPFVAETTFTEMLTGILTNG